MSIQGIINTTSENIVKASIVGGAGYLCARYLVTGINPVHGAVFCAISTLVSQIVYPIFDRIFAGPGASSSSVIVGGILSIVSGVAISAAIATAAGFSITFYGGLLLTATVVGVIALTLLAISGTTYVAARI